MSLTSVQINEPTFNYSQAFTDLIDRMDEKCTTADQRYKNYTGKILILVGITVATVALGIIFAEPLIAVVAIPLSFFTYDYYKHANRLTNIKGQKEEIKVYQSASTHLLNAVKCMEQEDGNSIDFNSIKNELIAGATLLGIKIEEDKNIFDQASLTGEHRYENIRTTLCGQFGGQFGLCFRLLKEPLDVKRSSDFKEMTQELKKALINLKTETLQQAMIIDCMASEILKLVG